MRRAIGVVMNGHLRRSGARNVADSDEFEIIFRDVVIRALDFESDTLTRFKQDAVWADFNIEFIDLIGFERLSLGMQVDGLPGL